VLSSDGDRSAGNIIESWKKRADGRLSSSGWTDQGNGLSGFDFKVNMIQDNFVIFIAERYIIVGNISLRILNRNSIFFIDNFRFRLDNIQETSETGQSLLDHFRQFHEHLDRADKNTDVQGVHGKICRRHFTEGNEDAAGCQSDQVHKPLEKCISALECSHGTIVILLGEKEVFIPFVEFSALNIFISKRLNDPNAFQRILKGSVDVADFAAVVQEGCLHPLILVSAENDHKNDDSCQNQSQFPLNQKQEDEGTDTLYHRDEQVFRSVMGKFRDIKQVGYQTTHHLSCIILVIIRKRKIFIMFK